MADLPYSFEPLAGYSEYKLTSILKDYISLLMEQPENKETIDQILNLVNGYIAQLKYLRVQNAEETTKEIFKAVDGFFIAAADDTKKDIQCKEGCTACCFIEIDVSGDEVAAIINYCRENGIEIDREYLTKQAVAGRKIYSDLSRCVFLKDNLCSIYPVRPVACRKHWVKTDPVLCDFSKNIINPVGKYFDINTEILASALLNVDETGSLENMLLCGLDKTM
jgi:Putative zinc- or iron-chelating domain